MVSKFYMKTLVAIANFGKKNEKYLLRLLEEYRTMIRYKVDIVVLSNIPKILGPDIEVIVGLPTKDPWSLPLWSQDVVCRSDETI